MIMEDLPLTQLSALAHPQRLLVFRLLMRRHPQSVAAGDIATALDLPRSTLSPYLSALRRADLITQTRDGTSLLYCANMGGAGNLIDYLLCDCARGRPGMAAPMEGFDIAPLLTPAHEQLRVLFLCTGNSARSIMAEVILRDLGMGRFASFSAGTRPNGEVHPMALRVLQEKGHDVTDIASKTPAFLDVESHQMDLVLTVCDNAANEECPLWPGMPLSCHWGVPDPANVTSSEAEQKAAFDEAYTWLERRVGLLAALPLEDLERASLQRHVDEIAKI